VVIYQGQSLKTRAGAGTQAVEHLLSKCEVLSSNPSTAKKIIKSKRILKERGSMKSSGRGGEFMVFS
jgi:hypothetical protein